LCKKIYFNFKNKRWIDPWATEITI
jgi:hypothetical protein